MSDPKSIRNKAEPRLSASLILLNKKHEVLMIQRVQDSRTFAGMHAFPGGNYDPLQDGPSTDPQIISTTAMTALRETFEETGLLLAEPICYCTSPPTPLRLSLARRAIHSRTDPTTFPSFLAEHGLSVTGTMGRLIPFSQWVTPTTAKSGSRFWTWFYVAFLDEFGVFLGAEDVKIDPNSSSGGGKGAAGLQSAVQRGTSASASASTPTPTHDNHVEIQSAYFASPRGIIQAFDRGDITLMPPQYYLLSMLADILDHRHAENKKRGEDCSAGGYLREVVGRGFGGRMFNPRFGGRVVGEDGVERSVLMYEGDEEYGKGVRDDGSGSGMAKHRSLLTFVDGVSDSILRFEPQPQTPISQSVWLYSD